MVDFRYAQFCPLTRAVEILGERWTLLILRELFLGSKRFSDLKTALNGVSPSVLAVRLAKLEERGIVARRELPPPAASIVYELDDAGRALRPLLVELTRWGVRFMQTPGPADSVRPEWLLLGFEVFARARASEPITAHLHVEGGTESVDIYVRGGAGGTTVSRTPLPHDVRVSAPPMQMLMFANGLVDPVQRGAGGQLTFEGDANVVRRIPLLFDFAPTPAASDAAGDAHPPDQTAQGRALRPQKKTTKRKTAASGGRNTAEPKGRNTAAENSRKTAAKSSRPTTAPDKRRKGAARS